MNDQTLDRNIKLLKSHSFIAEFLCKQAYALKIFSASVSICDLSRQGFLRVVRTVRLTLRFNMYTEYYSCIKYEFLKFIV